MLIKSTQRKPLRILLIRFSSIGDIVLTTPVVKAIKEATPDAILDYLTLSEYSSLLKDIPFIDNLFVVDRSKGFIDIMQNILLLRSINYDFIFDLHRSTRSLIFRLFLKSKNKNKFKKNYFKRFLLTNFKISLQKKPYTVVNRYFNTAKALHLKREGKTEIWLKPDEIQRSLVKYKKLSGISCSTIFKDKIRIKSIKIDKGIFNKKSKIISFMPFAKWQTKEWGDDRFVELGRKLKDHGETLIQILGGQNDAKRAIKIAKEIGKNAISLSGMLSLAETAVVLSLSDCLITNDTGIMHIGGAVSVPVVAVFGCTTEELGFFPYNTQGEVVELKLSCRPCTAKGLPMCPKKHFKCMNDITIDMVYSALIRKNK